MSELLSQHRLYRYGAVLVALLCSLALFKLFPYQIDDAFITYRYSYNFLMAGDVSFNIGFENVEGFSTQLWFFLAAGFGAVFGADNIHYSGIVFGVAAYLLLMWAAYRAEAKPLHSLLSVIVFAITPYFIWYAATGMETMAFVLLVSVFGLALLERVPFYWAYVCALLAMWVRPEAPWLMVMLGIVWLALPDKRQRFFIYSRIAAVFFLSALALLFYRYQVFNDWLPNTYYEKQASLLEGVSYAKAALSDPAFLLLSLVGLWSAIVTREAHKRVLYLLALSWFIVPVLEGGDWMLYQRFYTPYIALLLLSFDYNVFSASRLRLAAIGLGFSALLVFNYGQVQQAHKISHNYQLMMETEDQWLANWLSASGVSSVAAIDIGRLGYYSRLEVLDLGGLTDKTISRIDGQHMEKAIPFDYILQRSPDIMLFRLERKPESANIPSETIMSLVEAHLMTSPALYQHYRPLFVLAPNYPRDPYYGLLVFGRQNLPQMGTMMADLPLYYDNGLPFVSLPMNAALIKK